MFFILFDFFEYTVLLSLEQEWTTGMSKNNKFLLLFLQLGKAGAAC